MIRLVSYICMFHFNNLLSKLSQNHSTKFLITNSQFILLSSKFTKMAIINNY
jgi:hypothetical protein